MKKAVVNIGDKFQRWTIIKEVERKNRSRRVLCECSCGKIREQYLSNIKTGGSVSCGCYSVEQLNKRQHLIKRRHSENHPNYKGGHIRKDGYLLVSEKGVLTYAHRVIMEKKLNRKLSFDETIHHIDGNRSNNNIENLLLISRSEHSKQYHSGKLNIKKNNEILFAT
jgi:hypothetical protein